MTADGTLPSQDQPCHAARVALPDVMKEFR